MSPQSVAVHESGLVVRNVREKGKKRQMTKMEPEVKPPPKKISSKQTKKIRKIGKDSIIKMTQGKDKTRTKKNVTKGHPSGKELNGKTKHKKQVKNRNKKNRQKKEKIKDMAQKKKVINKSNKLGSYQRGLEVGSHPDPQNYLCDFFGMTKAQSVSRTQLSRAKRILKRVKALKRYSTEAATAFIQIIANMDEATRSGTTCRGKPLQANGVAMLDTLKNCSVSVPAICDITQIADFNETVLQRVNACIDPLNTFGTRYKVSSNNKKNVKSFFFRKSSSGTQEMMQEMCATKWHS